MKTSPKAAILALAAVAALVLVASRFPLFESDVVAPLRAQAEGRGGGGYTFFSLAFWAAVGAGLGAAGWAGVIAPLRIRWDASFALALAPFLVFGPLFHALLAAGAWARGSVLAYAATEPLVYVTTAILASAALALGRLAPRAPLVAGLVALLLLAPATLAAASRERALAALGLLAAGIAFAALAWAAGRAKPLAPLGHWAGAAVVGAHALDGLGTWIVLRDPFGWGFGGFAEKNPLSSLLVEFGSGVAYPVAKILLAVGLALYLWKSTEEEKDRALRAPLLLVVFALGWGPGASNVGLVAFG